MAGTENKGCWRARTNPGCAKQYSASPQKTWLWLGEQCPETVCRAGNPQHWKKGS